MPDIELTFEQPIVGSAYSPQVEVTDIEHGHRVTITYRDVVGGMTTLSFDVLNGDGSDPNSIGTTQLINGSVTTAKLAGNAVTTSKLAEGAVTEAKIGSDAVTNKKIGQGAVTTAKIENGAVTTEKLENSAVTAAKVGTGVVTDARLAVLSLSAIDALFAQ